MPTEAKDALAAFAAAIDLLDQTEPQIREWIESDLMGVTPEKANLVVSRLDGLMTKINALRSAAVKRGFRMIREKIDDWNEIDGASLATHAHGILASDLRRIQQTLTAGVNAGLGNTDTAHFILGSRPVNGVNGQTEITRQLILRLARGYLRKKVRHGPGSTKEMGDAQT